MSALTRAWSRFIDPAKRGQEALALSVSRSEESDEQSDTGPFLHEAVLLVEGGRMEISPLFGGTPSGVFSLSFCDAGQNFMIDCTGSGEQHRAEVKINAGRPLPIPFDRPEGLYRVRLWRMTPRGPQATERTAIALIGSAPRYREAQIAFQGIANNAEKMVRTDPMIRNLLGAWLAEKSREAKP